MGAVDNLKSDRADPPAIILAIGQISKHVLIQRGTI